MYQQIHTVKIYPRSRLQTGSSTYHSNHHSCIILYRLFPALPASRILLNGDCNSSITTWAVSWWPTVYVTSALPTVVDALTSTSQLPSFFQSSDLHLGDLPNVSVITTLPTVLGSLILASQLPSSYQSFFLHLGDLPNVQYYPTRLVLLTESYW